MVGSRISRLAAETLQGLLSRLCEARAALATNGGERTGITRWSTSAWRRGRCFFMQSLSLLAARGIAASRLWCLLHGACSDGLASQLQGLICSRGVDRSGEEVAKHVADSDL